jgi:hypothetical protein
MIRFRVEPVPYGKAENGYKTEHAVYVESSKGGNDKALFLVFDSYEAAMEAAYAFEFNFRTYNQLHG